MSINHPDAMESLKNDCATSYVEFADMKNLPHKNSSDDAAAADDEHHQKVMLLANDGFQANELATELRRESNPIICSTANSILLQVIRLSNNTRRLKTRKRRKKKKKKKKKHRDRGEKMANLKVNFKEKKVKVARSHHFKYINKNNKQQSAATTTTINSTTRRVTQIFAQLAVVLIASSLLAWPPTLISAQDHQTTIATNETTRFTSHQAPTPRQQLGSHHHQASHLVITRQQAHTPAPSLTTGANGSTLRADGELSAGKIDLATKPTPPPQPLTRQARARGPRIYRIRAAPLNGRLGSPIRVEELLLNSDQRTGHQLIRQPISSSSGGGVSNNSQPTGQQQQLQLQFGARSSPATNLRIQLKHQQQPASTKSSSTSNQQQQQLNAAPACNQSSATNNDTDEPQTSTVGEPVGDSQGIAASSQTLQLHAPKSKLPQPISRLADNSSHAQSPHSDSGGEIDESESEARGQGPVAVAAPVPPTKQQAPERPEEEEETKVDGRAQQQPQPAAAAAPAASIPLPPATNLIDEFDSKMITHRAKAQLSCDSGEMILRLNFTDPFKGIVYPDHNRLSPCRFFGDSHHNYELRLPLRSCGTRQVAPRIFVNDVIVRFHKSLELEEDEIKTLICRYPPPLALQATQSYGQGLVHGLEPAGSPQTSGVEQRRPLPPYEPTSTGQQFELIEPTSGQRSPTAGSISQIELLPIGNQFGGSTGGHRMAPGQQHPSKTINQQLFDDNPQLQQQQFPFGRQKNANIIGLPGTDQVAQSESGGASMIGRIITGNGSAGSNSFNQKQRTTGMLDRLTSIELLFLISSLMFLILLAVGLLGAYYCVKRRRRRRPSSTQTASAILRRKRRYLSPNGSGIHRASLAPPEVVITNDHHLYAPGHQPGSRSYYHTPAGLNQQHQIGAAGRDRFYNGSQLQLHPVEASSPESDQSGHQVLLPTAKSQQQQQQTHMLPIRRHQNTNQLVYDNQPAAAGHQQMNNGAAGGTAPVLGRRAESGGVAYATAGPALGRGHQQQQHLATNLNQYQAAAGLAGRRHQQPPTGGGRSSATTRHQPLLQMVGRPNQKSNQFEQPFSQFNTIGRLNNAGAETTNWPNKNPDHKHHHEHNLARTKSMQQLQPMPNPSDPSNGWRSLSRAGATTTLKHQGTGGNGRHRGQAVGRPRQMVAKTASIMRPRPLPTAADHHYDHQKHHQLINYNDDDDGEFQVSSDSEIELHQAGSSRLPLSSGGTKIAGHHMPRLYLKSIEDRFITNVTEINEQEYVKQDSRKILSWTQWRAMQPTTTTTTFGKPAGDKSKNSDATDDKKANNASRLILDDNDEDDDVQSNQANLRSLTELDVNYAKSLLLNPDGTAIRHQQTGNSQVTMIKSDPKESAPADANKAQTTTTQATRGTGQSFDPKQDPGKQESHLKGDLVEKLIKIPVRNKAQLALQDKQQLATTNTHQTDDKLQRAQTSDLIISPEYECDPTADDYRRLKLTSSPTSQDSVSYV